MRSTPNRHCSRCQRPQPRSPRRRRRPPPPVRSPVHTAGVNPQPEPSIVLVTVGRASASVVLSRSDGKEARFPLTPNPFEDTSMVSRFAYALAGDALLATTTTGDHMLFELPTCAGTDRRAGRLA